MHPSLHPVLHECLMDLHMSGEECAARQRRNKACFVTASHIRTGALPSPQHRQTSSLKPGDLTLMANSPHSRHTLASTDLWPSRKTVNSLAVTHSLAVTSLTHSRAGVTHVHPPNRPPTSTQPSTRPSTYPTVRPPDRPARKPWLSHAQLSTHLNCHTKPQRSTQPMAIGSRPVSVPSSK